VKAWKKTSPELVAASDKAVPVSSGVTRRPMFGYPSAFVNGNMFAGTFQDTIVVRLMETDRVVLVKVKGAAPFKPMGHAMKEYIVVPAGIVAKPKELGAWIERGHRYALTLPAKGTTKKTTAKKSAATKQTATKTAVRKRPAARKTARRTS
jgi:TfoX/Sxy family transcriptional regulator of competence genes